MQKPNTLSLFHHSKPLLLEAPKTNTTTTSKKPAILQRVLSASVTVDKEVVSSIGKGVLVFAAVAPGDTEKEVEALAAKVLRMKLWDDEESGARVCCSLMSPREFPVV